MPVERVLHAPAVHFKGKGFYNTDYGKRKPRSLRAATATPSRARRGLLVLVVLRRGPPGPSKDGASKDCQATSAKGGSSSKDQKTVTAGSSGS